MQPKAILLGALVDWLGTLVGGAAVVALAASYFMVLGSTDVESSLRDSTGLQAVLFIFGTIYTVVGGFTCARYSRGFVYRNAALMGLVSTAIGVFYAMPSLDTTMVAALSTTFPAAIFGAWLSLKLQRPALSAV